MADFLIMGSLDSLDMHESIILTDKHNYMSIIFPSIIHKIDKNVKN